MSLTDSFFFGKRPRHRLPIATKEGIYAGELNFHIHWTKTEVRTHARRTVSGKDPSIDPSHPFRPPPLQHQVHYRKPVQLLQKAVAKTQALTAPVEPFLEKALAGTASLGSTIKTKVGRHGDTEEETGVMMVVDGKRPRACNVWNDPPSNDSPHTPPQPLPCDARCRT